MSKLIKWLKHAATSLVDPEKSQRVQTLTTVIQTSLSTKRHAFSLSQAVAGLDYSATDLADATAIVYREALRKGWADGILSPTEQKTAEWIAIHLEMQPDVVKGINTEFARHFFSFALAKALEDGALDHAEEARLVAIAQSIGCSIRDFTRSYFRNEAEGFLRSIFLAGVAGGFLSTETWTRLLATSQRLGLTHEEMLAAIQPQAKQFVEHVLADAKADNSITDAEENVLNWLLSSLALPIEFVNYVRTEVGNVKLMQNIESGRLATYRPPTGIELKAGENVYFYAYAVWREAKVRSSGVVANDHNGMFVLTDDRVIFHSTTKSQSLLLRRVVAHRGGLDWIELQFAGKPVNTFIFHDPNQFAYPICRSALAIANQTKVAPLTGTVSRHIPRDVRQRVWQRYGGQCVECSARDYLEFDHIIPVSRGGNNSETNVQILCRRCNLKKSDHI